MKIVIDCYHISEKMRGMGVYLSEVLTALVEITTIDFYLVTNNTVGAKILSERFCAMEHINVKLLSAPLPVYEQILLPIYCRKIDAGFLLSSGNTATMFGFSKRQILLIHDVYYLKKKKNSDAANSVKRKLGEIYRKSTISIASKKAPKIITVSQFAKKDIVNELGVAEENITVIHNGVNPDFCSGYEQLVTKQKRILFVTGASPQKNVPNTIKALVSNSDLIKNFDGIDVVGVSCAEEIGLKSESFVVYHGHVSRDDVKRLYLSSSHFMLPSLYESFGIPAIEALMAGCDVYLSSRGAMATLLSGVGSFYDPLDESALDEIVSKIAFSNPLTQEEYEANVSSAHKYTWQESILALRHYLSGL